LTSRSIASKMLDIVVVAARAHGENIHVLH
jgi:hypothetical protein